MPEAQTELPLETPKAPNRFVIPDDALPEVPEVPVVAEEVPKTDQNTGAEATPAKPDAKPEPEPTPEQVAKRSQNRLDRKLEKAFKQRAEAQAKADILEKRLAELEKPKLTPLEGEPKLEQFDYDPEKYATAKAEFARTQVSKELEAKTRTESETQFRKNLVSGWEGKVAKGEDKYDDWQEKVGDLQPDSALVAAIMEAENGEEVAYFLGSNPKEAKRISLLTPLSQIREIGKLEAKLSLAPTEPKTPSKAPAPISPLSGAASITSAEPSEQDDVGQWIKKRQKQVHGR